MILSLEKELRDTRKSQGVSEDFLSQAEMRRVELDKTKVIIFFDCFYCY